MPHTELALCQRIGGVAESRDQLPFEINWLISFVLMYIMPIIDNSSYFFLHLLLAAAFLVQVPCRLRPRLWLRLSASCKVTQSVGHVPGGVQTGELAYRMIADMRILYKSGCHTAAFKELTCFVPDIHVTCSAYNSPAIAI